MAIVKELTADEFVTFALNLIQEKKALSKDVIIVSRNFIEDVYSRLHDFDIQYLTYLKTFL